MCYWDSSRPCWLWPSQPRVAGRRKTLRDRRRSWIRRRVSRWARLRWPIQRKRSTSACWRPTTKPRRRSTCLIREADALGDKADEAALRAKVEERMGAITRAYQAFIEKYPSHARARIAFGSFLNDTGREDAAKAQWEKAPELDPKNPGDLQQSRGDLRPQRPGHQRVHLLRESHRTPSRRAGVLPEPGHHGVPVPPRRDGTLRDHERTTRLRQGVGPLSQGDGTGSVQLHPGRRHRADLLRDPSSPPRGSPHRLARGLRTGVGRPRTPGRSRPPGPHPGGTSAV